MRRPFKQGDMDGFCGIYTLVNAIKYLAGLKFTEDDASGLFRELVRVVFKRNNRRRKNKSKSPVDFIWEGTSVHDISHMLRKTKHFLESKKLDLVWQKPLQGRRRPKKIDQYWKQLQTSFEGCCSQGRCVAIVDYNWQLDNSNRERGHWTCVTNMTEKTMILLDSCMKKGRRFSKLSRLRCTLGIPTNGKPYRLLAHNVSILRVIDTEPA
ncbi:MAG: hypothetical protein FJ139_05735 [Deltaproteobacteria bacterium]|nr:hypothetical protein [Deltaproteobacteria bacterium]